MTGPRQYRVLVSQGVLSARLTSPEFGWETEVIGAPPYLEKARQWMAVRLDVLPEQVAIRLEDGGRLEEGPGAAPPGW